MFEVLPISTYFSVFRRISTFVHFREKAPTDSLYWLITTERIFLINILNYKTVDKLTILYYQKFIYIFSVQFIFEIFYIIKL